MVRGTSAIDESMLTGERLPVEKSPPVSAFYSRLRQCDRHRAKEIVFGDFGIARHLPAFQTTTIKFTPEKAGRVDLHSRDEHDEGKLVVERAAAGGD